MSCKCNEELVITCQLDEGAYMPEKAHMEDAGFDLRTPERVVLHRWSNVTIDTGVHMQIPKGYCGLLVGKSGLNVKNDITGTGLVDAGYSGSIRVKLYSNNNSGSHVFEKGDKIIQIMILPVPEVRLVEGLVFSDTERGNQGFGSSGR